jgi:hypothetical protein
MLPSMPIIWKATSASKGWLDADRATYQRRALAVERERAIAENELQNQIELARREEQLVAQRGANGRRQAEETAAAGSIEAEAQATREERLAEARAHGTRALGEAEAAGEAARVAAYRDLPHAGLLGLAAKDLAANLPQIGSLVLTPDLLAPLLARLAADPRPHHIPLGRRDRRRDPDRDHRRPRRGPQPRREAGGSLRPGWSAGGVWKVRR